MRSDLGCLELGDGLIALQQPQQHDSACRPLDLRDRVCVAAGAASASVVVRPYEDVAWVQQPLNLVEPRQGTAAGIGVGVDDALNVSGVHLSDDCANAALSVATCEVADNPPRPRLSAVMGGKPHMTQDDRDVGAVRWKSVCLLPEILRKAGANPLIGGVVDEPVGGLRRHRRWRLLGFGRTW